MRFDEESGFDLFEGVMQQFFVTNHIRVEGRRRKVIIASSSGTSRSFRLRVVSIRIRVRNRSVYSRSFSLCFVVVVVVVVVTILVIVVFDSRAGKAQASATNLSIYWWNHQMRCVVVCRNDLPKNCSSQSKWIKLCNLHISALSKLGVT